jgi:uncharacterized protein YxeA
MKKIIKKILLSIIIIILSISLSYFCFAFYNMEFNPYYWQKQYRLALMIFALLPICLLPIILDEIE